jgi:hypothetical protein
MKLKVRMIEVGEVYKDRVRIPVQFREGIREGHICKLVTGNQLSKLIELRGAAGFDQPCIFMDLATRQELRLQEGSEYDFTIQSVGWPGQMLWAWRSSDPAVRIAAKLGVLSVVLGLLSIIVAIVPILARK